MLRRHAFASRNGDSWMVKRPIDLATNWAVIGSALAEDQRTGQAGVYPDGF
jgi:hypothetical protein